MLARPLLMLASILSCTGVSFALSPAKNYSRKRMSYL